MRAELTTSARVGVHRYAFPKGADAKVLLDMRTSMYDYPAGAVVAGAGARRWYGDRLPRDARLGARSPAVLRDAFLAAAFRA